MKTIIVLFVFLSYSSFSQEYIETILEKSFGKEKNEKIKNIIRTSDNDYLLTGYTDSEGNGDRDIWVTKVSSTGEIKWKTIYGDKLKDEGNSTIETPKGFVTVGFMKDPLSGYTKGILLFLNKTGKIKRKIQFATSSYVKLNDIVLSGKEYYVVGVKKNSGDDDDNIFVAKLNSSFSKLWIQSLGAKYYTDEGFSVKLNSEGDIYVAGYSKSDKENTNVYCAKLDKHGNSVFINTIVSEAKEVIYDMTIDSDDNVVLVGKTTENTKGGVDMLFVKLDKNLKFQKKSILGNYKDDVLQSVIAVKDGYIAAGYTESLNKERMMYMLKFDSNGNVLWERSSKEYHQSEINGIVLNSDNTFTFAGAIQKLEGDKLDGIILQMKSNEKELIEKYINEKTTGQITLEKKNELYKEAIAFYSTKDGISLLDQASLATNEEGFSEFRGSGNVLKGLNVGNDINQLKVGKYYALIIGIDNYSGEWKHLKNAVNDARAIEQVLKTSYRFTNFKALYNEQATRTNIISAFEQLIKVVKPEDNVFIYYSGHGDFKQELNKGYWVPIDAKTFSTTNYISNSDLQTFLTGIESKHTLLVADACFSGDIFRGKTLNVPFENSERYYKKVYSLKSRQAMTSGGIEPVMDGGKDGHSVFAYYLLKALKGNQASMIDAGQVFDKLKIPVYNNSEQSPDFKAVSKTGDEGGQFIFMKK